MHSTDGGDRPSSHEPREVQHQPRAAEGITRLAIHGLQESARRKSGRRSRAWRYTSNGLVIIPNGLEYMIMSTISPAISSP
jgi:hypothetical protein